MTDFIIVLFDVCIGGYLIYAGITGRGKIYQNDNIRKGDERKHRKLVQIMSRILGPILFVLGVLEFLRVREIVTLPATVLPSLWFVVVALIVVWFILAYRVTDRQRKNSRPKGSTMHAPKSAFEFDEEESRPLKKAGPTKKK